MKFPKLLFTLTATFAWPQTSTQSLKVSDNQRFLVMADGKPFFWTGDTAWELFHRLDTMTS
jgi:hypothetical protein